MACSGTNSPLRMPLPDIKRDESASGTSNRYRIFVSYSHKDYGQFAKHFIGHLQLMIQNRSRLGYLVGDIFFDESGLKAGDIWDAIIKKAVNECEVMVFLVSRHSLRSKHCLKNEVRIADARGILIIPVILSDCEYDDIPFGTFERKRTLGSLHPLPQKEEAGKLTLVPVGRKENGWGDSEHAWDQVVKQIAEALEKRKVGNRTTERTPLVRRAVLPPLFPYRCNQDATVRDFENGLKEWNSSPLLTVLKGTFDDKLESFWGRLRAWNQNESLKTRIHGDRDIQTRPLILPPSRYERGGPTSDEEMKAEIWKSLSNSICSGKSISNPVDLAVSLIEQSDPLILEAILTFGTQENEVREKGEVIRMLIDLLTSVSVPEDLKGYLDKLVILILAKRNDWEDDLSLTTLSKSKRLAKLRGFFHKLLGHGQGDVIDDNLPRAGFCVVEPRPLGAFGRQKVHDWIALCHLKASISVDGESLIQSLFPDPKNEQPIRFAQLEKTLKEMELLD